MTRPPSGAAGAAIGGAETARPLSRRRRPWHLALMFDARIPTSALVLGLAGLLPFAWGVVTMWLPAAGNLTTELIGSRFRGPYVGLAYGTVILSFMSGVLWGFATRAEGGVATSGYALSTLPALWAFFMVGSGAEAAAVALIAGFVALLGLDWMFWNQGLAPAWWMKLRLILTTGVVLCLLPVML